MSLRNNILIGQALIKEGLITAEQLDEGLRTQKQAGEFSCATLVRLGHITEEKALSILARQLGLEYVRLKEKQLSQALISRVPAQFASHYKIIPIALSAQSLTVAMADPLDIRTLDDLRLILGVHVTGVLASEREIIEMIRVYYGVGADTLEKMVAERPEMASSSPVHGETSDLGVEETSIIAFVNQVLDQAIQDGASDIHLEPFQNELRTRFRIDGVLYTINTPASVRHFHQEIVSRIKIMSGLDIAERRLPQDGRMKVRLKDEELDLRVSIMPTVYGEAVHIRVLSTRMFLDLDTLGLFPEDRQVIEQLVKKQHGVIFVTGPTGSGKSTTLYAALARINTSAIKIITIEDPVEYQMRGINQLQVNPQIGFTFANALRYMLRHDPDVMMIGEVRDYETAEIAIRSALTGHLVLSTLHTNDAAGAITRLLDMGVEPFLVSSSLECLIAQRLVRVICPACKVPAQGFQGAEAAIVASAAEFKGAVFYEAKGCKECRFTGYRGRTGIYEVLVVTDHLRELILKKASSQQIKNVALEAGMRTLRLDGLRKASQGITTLAEVIRVTQQEELF